LPGAKRRQNDRLAVSRTACFELMGAQREQHYEQRLLLGLPWYCPAPPRKAEDSGEVAWHFKAELPNPSELGGACLPQLELHLSKSTAGSFEDLCKDLEQRRTLGATTVLCVSAAPDHRPASLAALQLGFMPAVVSHRVRSAGAKALCTTTRSMCSGAFSTCTAKARPCSSSGAVQRCSSNTCCCCFARNNEHSKSSNMASS